MDCTGDFLYLSRTDVEELRIPMRTVIDIIEEALEEKAKGRIEMPPKPGIHPQEDSFIHAMPAYLPKMGSAGLKWVSGFPNNPRLGLSYIMGLIILNNPETGSPVCVMDCTWVTAKRTGAATAVAARYLAREDSRTLGILGCGVQGRSNLEASRVTCKNLEEVKAYDIDARNLQRYVEEMTAKHEVKVVPVNSPRKAVEECDIVVTAGPILKHPRPVIESSWLKEGSFACPLDFDSYWKPQAMHSVDKFCTDDFDQLTYYKEMGYFANIPEVYAELSEIVAGKKTGRKEKGERIMSMNLGLAIEDMATAIYVYERAQEEGVGRRLPL